MALTGKLKAEVEVKAPADKFFSIVRSESHQIPNATSDKIHNVEMHEGDWEADGSIKLGKYTVGKKTLIQPFLNTKQVEHILYIDFLVFSSVRISENVSETIEAVDDRNKSVTCNALDGNVAKYYKTFKGTVIVTASGQGSLVKWTLIYEKQNQNVPDPKKYLEFTTL
ncbi:MLP-like protein 43 [Durio zibethinus]|uniref:MLP-like protein 43 n=1 Tax=Durio zibethinus TaxID=66656 RepID=A0A6P6BFH4_DURZI|nr:MLP-like protein 43 [Durio zibethinus]